jgi:alkanesulfonate monooxygenase SsuD/methylene tetrahydromethanopterin reductase-like flavin-dependent oxidoreductase (luciferase family)
MDQLEEGIAVLRGLLHDEVTTFEGRWFSVRDARNEPRPVQDKLPIWVGGGGERRTLRITARYADGWNVPFVDPAGFAAKREVLHRHCTDVGRDPAEIRCAVNVGLAWSDESLRQQFGALAERVRPGVLGGSVQEVVDRVGAYVDAGADQVNLALRAPFDDEALDRFAATLGLVGG